MVSYLIPATASLKGWLEEHREGYILGGFLATYFYNRKPQFLAVRNRLKFGGVFWRALGRFVIKTSICTSSLVNSLLDLSIVWCSLCPFWKGSKRQILIGN